MNYVHRLNVIEKAFNRIEYNNNEYIRISNEIQSAQKKLQLISNLSGNTRALLDVITVSEKQWRTTILSIIECEISKYLSYVYPEDNYSVQLDCDIKYGKIKINATVSSNSFDNLKLTTQGRLFKQIVSLAAIASIMKINGIKTIYLDEAFSGASKENMALMGKIISEMIVDGINLVLIIQHEDLIPGNVDWHSIYLTRGQHNCTVITEKYIRGCNDE